MLMMQKELWKNVRQGKSQEYLRHIAYQTCFIFLEKNFSQEERRFLLKNLCEIFQISDLNEKKIVAALENNAFSDFEDGLQEECAVEPWQIILLHEIRLILSIQE